MNYIMILKGVSIILASILLSSEAIKYKQTNLKPLNCEVCLSFWLSMIYIYSNYFNLFINKHLEYIFIGCSIAMCAKIVNVLLIKFYGNLISK